MTVFTQRDNEHNIISATSQSTIASVNSFPFLMVSKIFSLFTLNEVLMNLIWTRLRINHMTTLNWNTQISRYLSWSIVLHIQVLNMIIGIA